MIRLVACDLETTLLIEQDNFISEETQNLFAELGDRNILVAVVTGRNYDAVAPLFGNIKNNILFICNDGGTIIYQDRVISTTPIDRLICFDVENELKKQSNYFVSYATERTVSITTRNYDFLNALRKLGENPELIDDIKEINGKITKITIYSRKGFDKDSYRYFYRKWSGGANVSISNELQMDITAQYVNKGTALSLVQNIFEISKEDTVVFGGGYSDIEMFEHSYFSYAIQFADAQVKHCARYIAENVDTILSDILRMR